jgi:hypothetical protein
MQLRAKKYLLTQVVFFFSKPSLGCKNVVIRVGGGGDRERRLLLPQSLLRPIKTSVTGPSKKPSRNKRIIAGELKQQNAAQGES